MYWKTCLAAIVVGMASLGMTLTSRGHGGPGQPSSKPVQLTAATDSKDAYDHSGWWCAEHGVPEEICSQCSPKIAAECKKKGDWCKEHDRARSQCFICNPKLKERFAAQYRAKYGKEPPPTEDDKDNPNEKK